MLLFGEELALDDDERRFVAGQAEQAAVGIVRTQAREREHDVATQLQRSLLPERLPVVNGLDLAARYNAGSTGLVIGGDWYDAVVRPDGLVHVTVGDVAGRGIEAATLMGQIRNAFRAYALEHTSPAEVLARLLRHVAGDDMATAVILTIDPATRRGPVRVGRAPAAAGAPGARRRRGCSVPVESAPPLGTVPVADVAEAAVRCVIGSALVLYTDGLVERRGVSIDAGIERLAAAIAAHDTDSAAGGSPTPCCAMRGQTATSTTTSRCWSCASRAVTADAGRPAGRRRRRQSSAPAPSGAPSGVGRTSSGRRSA